MSSMAPLAIILLSHFDRNKVFSIRLRLKVTLQAHDNVCYIVRLKNNFNTLYITYAVLGYLGDLNFSARPLSAIHSFSSFRFRG